MAHGSSVRSLGTVIRAWRRSVLAWPLALCCAACAASSGDVGTRRGSDATKSNTVGTSWTPESDPLNALPASEHCGNGVLGTFAATATFVLFYLMTVFSLSWGTSALGYSRTQFLVLQMVGVVFFGLTIPLSAVLADRHGNRRVIIWATVAIIAFGLVIAPLFGSGTAFGVFVYLALGLALMGLTYGPLGTALAALFPTAVRYTGASLTFNLAGIVGASLAPYAATWLASHYGLAAVGFYLSVAGVITLIALIFVGRVQPSP